ncbi:hypothetical protein [Halococcoides cellulosivorans]|uniref:hypothetical protein n=1 Tax=Halococcoides cellulosivorans TaxID=1679096 RepID=UPI00131F1FF2|nr:hypothetical protein [Halococcoides cellulosivorans]
MPEEMTNSEPDRKRTISRRTFMGVAGALPVTAITGKGTLHRARKRVTRVRVNNGKHRVGGSKKLNTSWLSHRKNVERKLYSFKGEFLSKPGVCAVSITNTDKKIGGSNGRQKFQYEVKVDPEVARKAGFDPETDLPSIYRGVPVTKQSVSQKERPRLIGGDMYPCYNNISTDTVSGGCVLQQSTLDDSWGTSCFAFTHNGVRYLVTANHVVGEAWEDNTGNTVYDADQYIGRVEHSFPDLDVAYIGESHNIDNFEDNIKRESDSISISGYINKLGISDRAGQLWDTNRKMGTSTGDLKGAIRNYKADYGGFNTAYEDDWRHYKGEGVEGEADSAGGDSGGPAYDVIEGEAWLLYMTSASSNGTKTNKGVCYSDDFWVRGTFTVGPAVYSMKLYSDPSKR